MVEQTSADELSGLLPQALDIVLQWIRHGEQPHSLVSPWRSNAEARSGITLSLPEEGVDRTELLTAVSSTLAHSVNPWTGRFLDKLYSAPHPVGLLSELVLAALNANAHVMSASPLLTLCEEACVARLAGMLRWDENADGLTMPGGSASNTLALQTALASVFPSFKADGVVGVMRDLETVHKCPPGTRPLMFTSEQSHYSLDKAAIACGLGLSSLRKIACDSSGRMDPDALDAALAEALTDPATHGFPFFLNATSGSTVLGSFDDIARIHSVCVKHSSSIWLHVDASWGGPVLFSERWGHLLSGVDRADSFTINPHKALNVPLQASFLLVRNGATLRANALDAAYLFHDDAGGRCDDAALKTMGCGRKGDALKLYFAWLRYGRAGFGAHIDAGFELARRTVLYVQQRHARTLELGPTPDPLFLQVCFRPRLDGADVQRASAATKRVHTTLRQRRRFAVDFAPLPNGIGDFIRLVVHPRTAFETITELVDDVARFGQEYAQLGTVA